MLLAELYSSNKFSEYAMFISMYRQGISMNNVTDASRAVIQD